MLIASGPLRRNTPSAPNPGGVEIATMVSLSNNIKAKLVINNEVIRHEAYYVSEDLFLLLIRSNNNHENYESIFLSPDSDAWDDMFNKRPIGYHTCIYVWA